MKELLRRESEKIAATMKNFQAADLDFQKARAEKETLRDAFQRCFESLQSSVAITRYSISTRVA